jgi:hypothetical protein
MRSNFALQFAVLSMMASSPSGTSDSSFTIPQNHPLAAFSVLAQTAIGGYPQFLKSDSQKPAERAPKGLILALNRRVSTS